MAIGLFAQTLLISGCGQADDAAHQARSASTKVMIRGLIVGDSAGGATVTITSLKSNGVIATAVADEDGAYVAGPVSKSLIDESGYLVRAVVGESRGDSYRGTMRAVYASVADYSRSHLTILTTAVTKAAEVGIVDRRVLGSRFAAAADAAVQSGILPADWTNSAVAMQFARAAASDLRRFGVDGYTSQLGWRLGFKPDLESAATVCTADRDGSRTCSARIGASGGSVHDATGVGVGNRLVAVSPTMFAECVVDVHAQVSDGDHTVRVWYRWLPIAECQGRVFSGPVSVSLPPLTDSRKATIPDACPAKRHSEMPHCLTEGAKLEPALFVTDDGKTHRSSASSHIVRSPQGALIERRYGANLSRARPCCDRHTEAAGVLFIHGYTVAGSFSGSVDEESFGGDDKTWGALPGLVGQLTGLSGQAEGFERYNFQWRTDASFHDVARELARAINYVHDSSGGRPIHIVAHSFGGVLARVALQRLYEGAGAEDWSGKVASVSTVGTPHAGINQETGTRTVDGVGLPVGWGFGIPGFLCGQISCYQAGLSSASVAAWAKESLLRDGAPPDPGYVIAELANGLQQPDHALPIGLKMQVLIGAQLGQDYIGALVLGQGDGLVSYYGQRFEPRSSAIPARRDSLLFEAPVGGAWVTERLLGLNPRVSLFPLDPVGLFDRTAESVAPCGYSHTAWLLSPCSGDLKRDAVLEVAIDPACGSAAQCQHDTWANVRDLLLALHGGPASPNFPTTTGNPVSALPSLTASVRMVRLGGTVTLVWDTRGIAESGCKLVGAGVALDPVPSQVGSQAVRIFGSTTFTLTCQGASASVRVDLIPGGFES